MCVELLHENPVENLLTPCKNVFIIVCLCDWAGPAFWLLCELELNRCSFKCSAAARDYYLCHREVVVVVCAALDLFSQEFPAKPYTRCGMLSYGCSGCCAFVH